MQTRSGRARGAKAAPPKVVTQPIVIQTPDAEASAGVPAAAPAPAAAPSRPLDRDDEGNPIDWSRPETLRERSGLWVAAWFLVPLIAVLLWGYLTR